jgi:hypothetical protein
MRTELLAITASTGAVAGAFVGAIATTTEGAAVAVPAGGLLCSLFGWLAMVRIRRSHGKLAAALGGSCIGAVAGAALVAFVGTVPGAVAGTMARKLVRRERRPGDVFWPLGGGWVGGLALAFWREQEQAMVGLVYGTVLGAGGGVLTVLLLLLASLTAPDRE